MDKRSRLVEAAARLVHRQGFRRTSLAHIAEESGVPLGNVYYYFKTKEAIGEQLVGQYAGLQGTRCREWDDHPDPRARLTAVVDNTVGERAVLARHGCPIGTLNAELHKDGGPLARQAAEIFADLLTWLETQFRELGREDEARALAVHLLSALQGVSLLAHTFGDPRLVVDEAARLRNWIRTL